MNILLTGANGQLAMEFQRHFETADYYQACLLGRQIVALDKKSMDISESKRVSEAISHYKPAVVLNCAAYNQVDKAEEDSDSAFKVNATGVRNLAISCKKNNILLVHYSTDYVFNGANEDFYTEDDIPEPINNYGKSKLSGERFLMEETDNFLLFRTSWVFGPGRQNFISKLNELAKKNRVIKVVYDQISVPTYTADIVKFTILAIEKGIRGIYHLTNSGYASRYEVARHYIERLKLPNMILPVSSSLFPSAARRPYFSAMSNTRLSNLCGQEIPDWRDAVDRFIQTMSISDETEGK